MTESAKVASMHNMHALFYVALCKELMLETCISLSTPIRSQSTSKRAGHEAKKAAYKNSPLHILISVAGVTTA